MTSFIKFQHRIKSNDLQRELRGPFVPFETIDLDNSITAIAGNVTLNCKNCKAFGSGYTTKVDEEIRDQNSIHSYLGHVGVIANGCFLVNQLEMVLHCDFTYKHVQTVQVSHPSSPINRPSITGGKWIRLMKEGKKLVVLVLTSNVGIYIYSEDGSRILCTYEFLEPSEEEVCRTIAASRSQILVGNGQGKVHTFTLLDGKVKFWSTIVIQLDPISQICCRRGILTTGSPTGAVRVWKIKEQKASKRCCFKTPSEECVTGLGIWENYIIATYGSGVFRVFHWASKRLMARVFAHSRWIVTMDLLPNQGLLLTISEDDAVLVWKLGCSKEAEMKPSGRSLKGLGSIKNIKKKIKNMQRCCKTERKRPKISIELDSTIHTENMMLVGGKFLNCTGTVVALANYGVKELYFYGRTES